MATPLTKLLGKAARQRREELGLSQEVVARRARMDRAYLSNLEGGHRNPSVAVVEKLAKALDLSAAGLLQAAEDLRG